jgi:hypothetical protein
LRGIVKSASGHWVRLGETDGALMIVFESEEAAQTAAEMFRTNPPPTVTPISIEVGEVQEHAQFPYVRR